MGVALLVIWADRRFKLGHGRAFALYVAAYCTGRAWIEYMRVDEAHHILGLRLNVWTAVIVFVLAVTYIVISAKVRPGREEVVEPGAAEAAEGAEDATEGAEDAKDADSTSDAGGDVERDDEDRAPGKNGTAEAAKNG